MSQVKQPFTATNYNLETKTVDSITKLSENLLLSKSKVTRALLRYALDEFRTMSIAELREITKE